MNPAANSAIFTGWVTHRRDTPTRHRFRFPLFMMLLDLGEIDDLFRKRWFWSSRRFNLAWFRRKDHLRDPAVPLDRQVRDLVERETGTRPEGPIRLLTHLRYFGYVFNPISLYYCFATEGGRVETVLAEVNNTPWGERHLYVLDRDSNLGTPEDLRFASRKELHVSPFMGMDQEYRWSISPPGERLRVSIENLEGGKKIFDAVLNLRRTEISGRSLAAVLLRYPMMTAQVILAIHFQALRLWLKRVPFRSHPRNRGLRETS